ncbi:WEB family protein At3g02930, chloroplastic-like [Cucurbita moschata]|uniref:WEB family protein At3g02930, chloroplastic-like n=1 Tax=Cucurbita moschata TaxID=3662 RepID=A0A6J1FXY4_CUCMO|nr:WEB family protein At3g02930, chloroplastic-like [Cucurbita moschata]
MSTKSKSSTPETPNKTSPATPRVSKLNRGLAKSDSDSHSPLQRSRLSIDRSPRPATSKPAVDRQLPKVATPPDKAQPRGTKVAEIQAQLNVAQEDLKKAKEQIILVENEREKLSNELKEAQKSAEEANEKLKEALVACGRAEESSEIERFRAVEMEQAGLEEAHKKEMEWQKEMEAVRSQHALDVAALLSTSQELQRVKMELAMTTDAKNQALSHADDATKIAEIHVEKVEILSAELTRLKALLDSKLETQSNENGQLITKLKSEIESLNLELQKAKSYAEKVKEQDASIEQLNNELKSAKTAEACYEETITAKEASIEQLNIDLEAAKMAETYAHGLVEEWKNRAEDLETQLENANKLERSASESLESVMKQLGHNNDLLHNAELEISALKEQVGLLEMTVKRQKDDMKESEQHLHRTKEKTSEMEKLVVSLRSQLETVMEEKTQALNNEKLAASSVQRLLEEKNQLLNELETSKNEEEKSKKAMESLASALHEISSEARETKEKLLSTQAEHENYESEIENLKMVLKATNERFESMLENSNHEIDILTRSVEESKHEFEMSKAEWNEKELHLVDAMKKSEEENSYLEKEIDRLVNLLKHTEEDACKMREEEAQLKDSLKEVEAEVIYLQEALGEAKSESVKLKESLLDKENELQSVHEENEELQTREAVSLKKVEELSKLFEEASAKMQTVENGEPTDSEKDYDLLPKVVEFSEENGKRQEEKNKVEPLIPIEQEEHKFEFPWVDNGADSVDKTEKTDSETTVPNGIDKPKEEEKKDESVQVEYKMWESCKIEKKEFSQEGGDQQEHESIDDEGDSKAEGGESFDRINGVSSENVEDGGNSPSKQAPPQQQQQEQKKKKPLLKKFGYLLKKKNSVNQKQ